MGIATMSTTLSQAKIQQQASISVMKMAMDTGKTQMNDMVQMMQESTKTMEQSVQPHLGAKVDIKL
ncbi:YjfB family protein [Schnuerera sp. xch1]|uniref:YjfB family protein n=1 Tax=Schnuerera sp. xch1 TaxID=2874283 RepID=UPI001CBC8B79|nr:YjfB family protein [Schnuerera sp. xch1]MBZ2174848.1 YjfB family protein [Schnuerera sp. xch1]